MARQPSMRGRWRIVDEPSTRWVDEEVNAFIRFDPDGLGEFHMGLTQGGIDYRLVQWEGRPGMEWTWEGGDEMDPVNRRGWAVLGPHETLAGMFFIHQGEAWEFRATKRRIKASGKRRRSGHKP